MNRLGLVFLLLLLLASACSLPVQSHTGFSIDMNSPHSSTYIWPLGLPLTLDAIGINDQNNSTQISFYASARNVGNATPASGFSAGDPKPEGSVDWTPAAAGEYFVQAQLHRGSNPQNAYSPAVRVCVFDLGSISATSGTPFWGYGYSGPCTIPSAPLVLSGTSTAVSIHAASDPASLAYFTNACPSGEGTLQITVIQFTATVDDPSGRVAFVTIEYHLDSGGAFDSLVLNQTAGGSTGTRTFSGTTVDLNTPLDTLLGGGTGTLDWEARAFDRSGNMIASEDHTMLVGPCVAPVHPLTIASPTAGILLILPTPTFTPASAKDCPAGTYFADVTHQCIGIATPKPTKPGQGCNLTIAICNGQGKKNIDMATCTCY